MNTFDRIVKRCYEFINKETNILDFQRNLQTVYIEDGLEQIVNPILYDADNDLEDVIYCHNEKNHYLEGVKVARALIEKFGIGKSVFITFENMDFIAQKKVEDCLKKHDYAFQSFDDISFKKIEYLKDLFLDSTFEITSEELICHFENPKIAKNSEHLIYSFAMAIQEIQALCRIQNGKIIFLKNVTQERIIEEFTLKEISKNKLIDMLLEYADIYILQMA